MTQIWIMTIPCEEMTKRELLFRLRRRAKRWQFGIEVGTHSGYEHYQVRYESSNNDVSIERRYWGDIACELQQAGGWSYYELKDGNYYTSMDDTMGKYRFCRLKELQLYILALAREIDQRKILTIIDKHGGIGKTFLGRWCDLNGKGLYIDGTTDIAGINRNLFDATEIRTCDTIFIDLTRQTKFSADLWSGIETIKNGYLQDGRYSFRSKWIPPPRIILFTNHQPADWDGLSEDRWLRLFIDTNRDETGKVLKDELKTRFYPAIGARAEERVFKS